MHVTTTANSVRVTMPETTCCSDNWFCNKITKSVSAIKSYISNRAYEITHPTRESVIPAMQRLAVGALGGLCIGTIYGFIATGNWKMLHLKTDEQVKIFCILMFGTGTPACALLFDILMYNVGLGNIRCCECYNRLSCC
jgi:hypothetical protein